MGDTEVRGRLPRVRLQGALNVMNRVIRSVGAASLGNLAFGPIGRRLKGLPDDGLGHMPRS